MQHNCSQFKASSEQAQEIAAEHWTDRAKQESTLKMQINQNKCNLKSHKMRQINILSLKSRTTKVILAVLSSSLACGMPNVFSNLLQAQQMANIVKAVFATLSSMRFFSEREDHRSTLQNFADDEHAPVSRLRLESDYLHVSETRNAVTSKSSFVKTFRSLLIRRFNKFVRRISNLGKI